MIICMQLVGLKESNNIEISYFIACVDAYVLLSVYRIAIPFLPEHVEYISQLASLSFVPALIILQLSRDSLPRHTENVTCKFKAVN